MASFNYIVSLPSVAEDNESIVNKTSILFKDAGGFTDPNEDCLGWNFNHCPNDDDYCQPFIKGDKLYLQFIVNVKNYHFISVEFINSATGQAFDYKPALTAQNGLTAERDTIVSWVIDTNNAVFDNVDCWYVKIKLYKCDFSRQGSEGYEEFQACKAAKIADGMTVAEANAACYDALCDDFDMLYSEPYCRVQCNQDSILIEGVYTKGFDCNGNYYGPLNSVAGIFKLATRIIGTIVPDGFTIAETVNSSKKVKSQQREKFLLRSKKKLPYYVIRQIVAAFNSQQLIIDSVYYSGATKLDKNFDEGEMWILSENVYRDCDEINFSCN